MNAKHRKTLASIFAMPVSRSLAFRDIESLLQALGCEKIEGPGSAVGYQKDGRHIGFHRPHPGKEAKAYQIKLVRGFLQDIGVES